KRNLIFVIAQHRVPFVWPFTTLAGRLSAERDYGDLACPVDFDARNTHTRGSHGPDDSGHVLLPECGGGARHWITVAKSAYAQSSVVPRAAYSSSNRDPHSLAISVYEAPLRAAVSPARSGIDRSAKFFLVAHSLSPLLRLLG